MYASSTAAGRTPPHQSGHTCNVVEAEDANGEDVETIGKRFSLSALSSDNMMQVYADGSEQRSGASSSAPPKQQPLLPIVACMVFQFIFSVWHILGARVMRAAPKVHVVSFTVARQLLSYLVLLILAFVKEGSVAFPKDRFKRIQIVLGGIFGGCLMPILYLVGLIKTTPTVTAIWDGPMLPIFVFCVTITLGMEHLERKQLQIGSLITAVTGSILVLVGDFHHHKSAHLELETWHDGKMYEFLEGNVVLIFMVASYTVMALVQRNVSDDVPPMTLTSWIFGVGALANIFMVILIGQYLPGEKNVGSGVSLVDVVVQITQGLQESILFCFGLAYASVGLTIGFSLTTYASKYLEASVVTLFCAAQPPITVVLEFFLFGKPISIQKVLGMIFVVVGMKLFTSSKENPKAARGSSRRDCKSGLSKESKQMPDKYARNIRRRTTPKSLSKSVSVV